MWIKIDIYTSTNAHELHLFVEHSKLDVELWLGTEISIDKKNVSSAADDEDCVASWSFSLCVFVYSHKKRKQQRHQHPRPPWYCPSSTATVGRVVNAFRVYSSLILLRLVKVEERERRKNEALRGDELFSMSYRACLYGRRKKRREKERERAGTRHVVFSPTNRIGLCQ